ncbi:MAG: HAMP domain-containing histidine kinase [Bacteriovoracaceae bacterium]|nr:HAMP domain-containing histidine kinase [Bacteriovoracaceae bacterium]
MGLCSIEEIHIDMKPMEPSITRIDDLLEGLSQVVHDIKSPLAALDTVLSNSDELCKEKKDLVQQAVMRIRNISKDVLSKNKVINELNEKKSLVSLNNILHSVVNEKLHEINSLKGVVININNFLHSNDARIKVRPSEFKRALSNILNNAVESLDQIGFVEINVEQISNGKVMITFRDNGKGIPRKVTSRLGQKGFTYGKRDGNGLGLYSALKIIKKHKGDVEISSVLRKGTSVRIFLPCFV